jgi:transcriptional regulator with XRE-family HTH domain
MSGLLDEQQRREIGQQIKRRYQELGLTLEQLEAKSGYDEKTIRNVIAGESARRATLLAIMTALGMSLTSTGTATEIADDKHGGYTKRSFTRYIGSYAAYRWSYDGPQHIIRSIFSLSWSSEINCGVFHEDQRYLDHKTGKIVDYSQDGEVYANNDAGVMHLLTCADGRLRLVTVTKLQPPDPIMRGSVLTQSRQAIYQQPAVSPVYLERIDPAGGGDLVCGELTKSDPAFAQASSNLIDVERNVLLAAFSAAEPEPVEAPRIGTQRVNLPQRPLRNGVMVSPARPKLKPPPAPPSL